MTDPIKESEKLENEEPVGEYEGIDPFSDEAVHGVQLIVQMRIYDAVMAVLAQLDGDAADALAELHASGGLMGSLPYLDLSGD